MTKQSDLVRRFESGGVLFDGGLGSMLIAAGLETGAPPEGWNLSRPEIVRGIHESYLKAGAEVITTNTFGATPSRMNGFGLGDELSRINRTGVSLAREAVDETNENFPRANARLVGLSVGPTGKMFPPVGTAREEEIRVEFERQFRCLDGGVDLILIETMFDVKEALLAVEAARALVGVPVAATLTFNKTPRGFFTIMGNRCADTMKQLEAAGADIVGANCTLASGDMVELGHVLRESTSLPVLCQPNAGSPKVKNGKPVYEQSPREYADDVMRLFDAGINAVGGCCGTTPDFIREVYSRKRNA